MKFSFTQNLFDMNVEKAARDYKETKDDASYKVIYEFVKKVASIVARKYNMQKDEDIVQNCGIKLVEKIHQFDPEKAPFYTWCYTIVVNEFKVKLRKNKFHNTDVEVEDIEYDYASPIKSKAVQSYEPEYFSDEYLTEEDIEAVMNKFVAPNVSPRRHVDYLDPKLMREIFFKYITEKPTFVDMVKEFGLGVNRIKLIIFRYRRYFIDFLKKEYPNKIFPEQQYGNKKEHKKEKKMIS